MSHDLDRGGVPDDVQDITHPSVVCVHRDSLREVWIAATPYPQDSRFKGEPYENTCIFHASFTGDAPPLNFSSIARNPIIYKDGAKYNSDCDLFYDTNENNFYAITRKRRAKDYLTRIVLQSSENGHEWSKPVVLMDTDRKSLCPCMVKANGKYLLYMFNSPEQYKLCDSIEIWESKSLSEPNFSLKGLFKWCDPTITIWHGDIDFIDGVFYMVFCGSNIAFRRSVIGGQDKSKYLWIAKSEDGVHWKHCQRHLLKANGVYRSTFFVEDDIMYIYVSFLNRYIDLKHPAGNRIGCIKIPMKTIETLF